MTEQGSHTEESAGLAVRVTGAICVADRSDDLIAGVTSGAVLGLAVSERDRGSTCNRSASSVGLCRPRRSPRTTSIRRT
jgi:hypothetical protein